MLDDAIFDIDPGTRLIIDSNISTLCASLYSQNKATIPLQLLVFLSDVNVLNYVSDLLFYGRYNTIDEIFEQYNGLYRTSFNRTHLKNHMSGRDGVRSPSDIGNDFMYVTIRNMVSATKTLLGDPKLPTSILGHLLAGAYYGGHDYLVTKILKKVKSHPEWEKIKYIGYTGAICAGRYHYVTEPINFSLMNELDHGEASDIITERIILSKDNIEKMLSDFIRRNVIFQNNLSSLDICIHGSKRPDLIQWFLISGLAVHLPYRRSPYSLDTWRFIRDHYDEVILSEDLLGKIEKLSLPDVIARSGIWNLRIKVAEYGVSLGIRSWPRLLEWCLRKIPYMLEQLESLMPAEAQDDPEVVAILARANVRPTSEE